MVVTTWELARKITVPGEPRTHVAHALPLGAGMDHAHGIFAELNGAELPVLLNSAAGSTDGGETAKDLTEAFHRVGVSARVEVLEPELLGQKLK